MASVVLNGVKKIYKGGFTAVKNFDLEIKDKEFVVFVGPSGCGKSTTLRMIAGLEEISEGKIYIDGKCVNDTEPKDRDIAMVFQNYALYPHMSVYENMAFGLVLRRVNKEEIHRRVLEAAEILGISDLLGRTPRALSGGQRQRVAIGRAIVRVPRVFLMDEPLSNLDAKLRNQMRTEIMLLREKIDTTFVYVTHDQTEAMTLGDRIVIMKDGYIQQVGTPREVFEAPANTFVAGFIGSPPMNFFKAGITGGKEKPYLSICGTEIPVSKKVLENINLPEDKKVLLGIRPEHIYIASGEGISGEIKVSEMMGSELHVHLITEDGTNVVVRVPTLELSEKDKSLLLPHNTVNFSLREQALHFFDTKTGMNINKTSSYQ
ncbi:MAG: sn-glycerol-3-phosphate ABC transporter ATP-binding protein UgpC [Clostridia bacterium]|nr:sn-glycerol-3-phosphate ABC transporter ATP-binding protein UgpC [Clostridia bacterium]